MVLRLFLLVSFTLLPLLAPVAQAEILFDGYYKVSSGGVHVGYIITRYEYDDKKKQFLSTSFTKTNDLGNNLTESLKTVSTKDMEPVSYSYTTLIGGKTKTIDAKFEKGKMIATVQNDGKSEKIIKDLPKGVFLSNVLVYMILRSKDGLKNDTRYDYQAVAEEDADILKGTTFIKGQEDYNGVKALKANNEFKNTKFTSFLTDNGEIIGTKVPVQQLTAELVAQPALATGSIPIPATLVKAVFGDIPQGAINIIAKSKDKAPAPPEPVPGKQKGIPPGKGIHIKGGAPTPEKGK